MAPFRLHLGPGRPQPEAVPGRQTPGRRELPGPIPGQHDLLHGRLHEPAHRLRQGGVDRRLPGRQLAGRTAPAGPAFGRGGGRRGPRGLPKGHPALRAPAGRPATLPAAGPHGRSGRSAVPTRRGELGTGGSRLSKRPADPIPAGRLLALPAGRVRPGRAAGGQLALPAGAGPLAAQAGPAAAAGPEFQAGRQLQGPGADRIRRLLPGTRVHAAGRMAGKAGPPPGGRVAHQLRIGLHRRLPQRPPAGHGSLPVASFPGRPLVRPDRFHPAGTDQPDHPAPGPAAAEGLGRRPAGRTPAGSAGNEPGQPRPT
ncbi:MAG: hypothetical protein BWY73_00619 [candidate division TA06 bacterium ADurb.Bin417]|uniref:Uncharacterized protein n=1 Tax=candidate division TA06 bacterium ADurb.Bin417 TaxID=1852828 RepID=A0A1V5MHV1_UNCT6|nr:MAG: hypothetical protein BWY73_00619 [candidate division TA06 bacterium ADurb.Bin417]